MILSDIVELIMAHATNQHRGLVMSLLAIEGRNMVDTFQGVSYGKTQDLETLVFISKHQHLLDWGLIEEIETFKPLFGTDAQNTPNFRTNLYLKLAQTLIHFQDVELNNYLDCTDIILAVLSKAKENSVGYRAAEPTLNPAVWESIQTAFVVIESRVYDFKNKLDEGMEIQGIEAIGSIEVFDRALAVLGNEQLIESSIVKIAYHHTLMAKAFAQARLDWFDLAIENYLVALTFFTRERNPHEWAEIKLNLGVCLQRSELAPIELSIEHYHFALTIFEGNSGRYRRQLGITYFQLAQCYDLMFQQTGKLLEQQKSTYYAKCACNHFAASAFSNSNQNR
ncbi:hypothetical protein [Chamaesiphon sp.]|uniref:hypothetical protein n=1 Tax=Chamaesiphon sp. TaxID=2814140 RepID=UPI0035934DD8